VTLIITKGVYGI